MHSTLSGISWPSVSEWLWPEPSAAHLLPCHQPQHLVCSLRGALSRGLQLVVHLWVYGWKDELLLSIAELSNETKKNR